MKKILMAAAIISTLFITGCKHNDPKAVLISFFDALAKKDIEGAKKLATAESKNMLDMMESAMKMSTDNKETQKYDKSKMEFGDAKVDGDKATVPVKEISTGETTNFSLKKEDGSWKVAFDKASLMQMGMEKMKENGGMDKLNNMNMDSTMNNMQDTTKSSY